MKISFFVPLILVVCSTLFPGRALTETAIERPPIILGQGEQRLLRIPGLLRYSLGSSVVRAHAPIPFSTQKNNTKELLLLKGVQPGLGDLWVWKQNGESEHRTIRVEKVLAEELKPALARELGALNETEILLAGSGVVLRGEIGSLPESAKIAALALGFPKDIHDETTPSETLLTEGRFRLERWIKESGHSSKLRVERIGKDLWLRGSIEHPSEQVAATKAAHAVYPRVLIEVDSLPDSAPTVHFRVFLLELRKNKFTSLGLGWPGLQEGAFRVTTGGIQDLLQLDLALQTLEGDGSVKILSNPELVVRAPGEAELFAGGELPIHTQNRFYSNISWKNYGLTLKLKVTHTTARQVRLEIFTEVSHLDQSIAMDKIPGIQANRMKTQVDARYGTPLLLSGLLQQGTREAARGLPLLRQIPVLGALFGSDDYLNEKSELVAILLPTTSPPPAPMHRMELLSPRGPVPPPRNWISQSEERQLKEDPNYPWNVLE